MNKNIAERDRRQKQLKQQQQIDTLQLQLKVLKQNYQKCIKSKQQLQDINTQLMLQIKQRKTIELLTKQKLRKQVMEQFRQKIREAELNTIKVQEKYEQQIQLLEEKFEQDLKIQFEREGQLNDVIKSKQLSIEKLEDDVFQLNEIIRKKDVKIQEIGFINSEYQSIVKSLRQQNSYITLQSKKFDGEILLLNVQITRLQDEIASYQAKQSQIEQQALNKRNELKYVSLIAGQNNQIKHVLLDQNTSLLNVANIMNRDIHDNRMRQYQMTKQLMQRTQELNRKDLQMNSLKYEVSLLPYKI